MLEEVVLPGYDAGVNASGVEHSRLKLQGSADRLFAKLRRIQGRVEKSQLHSPPSSHSEDGRSPSVFADPPSMIGGTNGTIQTFHCLEEKETWTYRCRCNFQIVRVKPTTSSSESAPTAYRYAMRSMGKPVLLGTKNSFPIATRRIQTAMDEFMEYLNQSTEHDGDQYMGANDNEEEDLIGRNGHLTSCTFSSAWRDTPESDCVLTLHYDHPIGSDGVTKMSWKRQAHLLCQKLRLRQLNGRSKGTLLSVKGGESPKNDVNDECENNKGGDEEEATIRDTIYILQSNCEKIGSEWNVSLGNKVPPDTNETLVIPVHYDKPETAFYHPNSNAMKTALAWMLNRLGSIPSSSPDQKLNLLEMYCGCGAHTVALGRSGLVSNILAVELDPRLVRACEANLFKNSLQTLVEVRRSDAGRWAKEESRKRRSKKRGTNLANGSDAATDDNKENYYDVLLVDPPRQGLDEEVCKMAMMTIDGEVSSSSSGGGGSKGESCFRNILYVSCGHQALLRDLERLSPVYEVVHCAQMDLFPRTDSIETLVHLKRRGS